MADIQDKSTDEYREKRRFLRVELSCLTRVEFDGQVHHLHSKDLSAGGIFLLSELLPAEETELDLEVFLPKITTPIKVTGEVVWVQNLEPRGFACQFIDIPDSSRDLIRQVVDLLSRKKRK